ncbi:cytochrome c oxidase accessory protein CcoG [Azospirillum brasilense]|uniref:Cytochrome c oxidase accessory protein CcoG n=1 Tax=Azospirillum brasilense TaxID=192 RepID=A0A0P0EBU4_AZOBR|nr:MULTISPECIES: cytochrome c oxidase accessory protein CcoG [Azospirillum]ALJ34969.1 cytochrome c oxidase accessory protein CcoG [Azospirillum brasilense]MDW7553457.1 cytochrome c oxidase accessory protein CcoG [Azospirillum brasilense]MDW7594337.1 cytochrome c oxidase accessory protein CcoG [Azospirillum brasilense]MDW7629209.1 cytochrome c oxidase accessory protein CcoG [Azospirillum brasilense]MDX5953648.1 cytochrome c oxidase accessory protein CcoG [Azospirillum brasilense]
MPDGSAVTPAKIQFFESQKKIHPKAVSGRYRRWKTILTWVLLAVFFIAPWIRWERGPDAPAQAVLFDLTTPRFFIFWIEIWPQEIYYLTGVLIVAALGLFLATALAGRVWCGFTCPQTVWTDLFVWIERAFEGDRAERIRLDKAPWTAKKVLRKTGKHAGWLALSVITGFGFVAFFTDAPRLAVDLLTFNATYEAAGFFALFAGMTYVMAGWTREQMCYYMCPWPRIQTAMLDEHSLVVTYDTLRGDTRGPKRKSQSWDERRTKGFGDCIDCGQCVQVCPVGVDIRTGEQADCINCGLCADACDNIMVSQELPKGLIRFDSLAAQDTRAQGKTYQWRLIRPRTIVYGLLMLVITGAMAWSYALRPRLDIAVQRDRAPLFVTLQDGTIRNAYTFKVSNKTRQDRSYTLAAAGIAGAEVKVVGERDEDSGSAVSHISASPDSVATYRVYVTVPRDSVPDASTPVTFQLTDTNNGDRDSYKSVFLAPGSK